MIIANDRAMRLFRVHTARGKSLEIVAFNGGEVIAYMRKHFPFDDLVRIQRLTK